MNYFGKLLFKETMDSIDVNPIMIHKGETKLAIYAISNMRESIFREAWAKNKFRFVKSDKFDEYFNILIIHQDSSLPLQKTPESAHFNLVIWGSELESQPRVVLEEEIECNVYRPGASVTTTFNEFEARTKHLGVLSIRRKDIQFDPFFLKDSHREVIVKDFEMKNIKRSNEAMSEEVKFYFFLKINLFLFTKIFFLYDAMNLKIILID